MKNNTRYAIIILSSIFLCSCGSKSYYNHLDGMRINNFNEYNSIALAYGNSSNVNLPREKLYQHGASSNKLELVGEKKNGEYEEIIFVSDDNIIQQNSFYIVDTLECNWFTFITVSNNMNNLCNNDNYLQAFGGEGGYFTYLLNKKSGLMYSCESIFNLGIQSANLNHIAYNNDVIFIRCDVQNNSIIIKISFENDVIVLQKIIDDTLLEYYSDHIMCDNFGTLFLTNLQHIYRITSNGKIYKCEEDLFFGPDQIAYTNKGLKYYDANGSLKDNDKYSF